MFLSLTPCHNHTTNEFAGDDRLLARSSDQLVINSWLLTQVVLTHTLLALARTLMPAAPTPFRKKRKKPRPTKSRKDKRSKTTYQALPFTTYRSRESTYLYHTYILFLWVYLSDGEDVDAGAPHRLKKTPGHARRVAHPVAYRGYNAARTAQKQKTKKKRLIVRLSVIMKTL